MNMRTHREIGKSHEPTFNFENKRRLKLNNEDFWAK
jgi:hypothetical protein